MVATPDKAPRLAAILSVLTCLAFAAFTHHAWEDYLITFRASLNLATGNGLLYEPGERVHSFTSPLGTLLPALFALGGGPGVEFRALWIFRLVSAIALGGAVWLAMRELRRSQVAIGAATIACGLWILDPKVVDFSINGMESAFLIFFVVLTWSALINGAKPWPVAVSFAGLQWTRPDGFIFFGALLLAWTCFGEKNTDHLKERPRLAVVRGIILGSSLYLPWVIFTWVYYGTPIPHTIIAKQLYHPLAATASLLASYPLKLIFGHVAIHDIFMPAYFYFGGWPEGLTWFARFIGTAAALTWVLPNVKRAGRVASAALFLGGFYLQYIPGSPWYFPAWQSLACIAFAYLMDALASLATGSLKFQNPLLVIIRLTGLTLVAIQIGLLGSVAWEMRNQQNSIEDHHRRQIGIWLRNCAAPHDRVYLEPLGYIGFYSELKMLDNPGLASPEVVAVRHSGEASHARIIKILKPEWLVLRIDQVKAIDESAPQLLRQNYQLARIFDVRPEIDAIKILPGRGYLDFDARFFVYSKTTPDTSFDGS